MKFLTLDKKKNVRSKKSFEQICNDENMNVSASYENEQILLDDIIYKRLREAEIEMNTTNKRYNINDIFK